MKEISQCVHIFFTLDIMGIVLVYSDGSAAPNVSRSTRMCYRYKPFMQI